MLRRGDCGVMGKLLLAAAYVCMLWSACYIVYSRLGRPRPATGMRPVVGSRLTETVQHSRLTCARCALEGKRVPSYRGYPWYSLVGFIRGGS